MTEPDDADGTPSRPDDPNGPSAPEDPRTSGDAGASAGSDSGGGSDDSGGTDSGSGSGSDSEPEREPEPAPEPVGWLPRDVVTLFGTGAHAEEAYGLLTVDVPPESWVQALETARDRLGCRFFDWLSAVDEPGTGFRVCAHVALLPAVSGLWVRRLLLRTTVPHEAPVLPTATGVFAGAAWHERETHEMFGVGFTGHPNLVPLLLPEAFEGHPLRKDFVLAARVAKAWPGAKEPGESEHGGPKRRQMLPPGVPDPNEWGPLKGQLPPVPSRPARGRAGAAGGERPVRRTRSASAGSASQQAADAGTGEAGAANKPTEPGTSEPTASQPGTAEQPRTAGPRPADKAGDETADKTADRPGDKPREEAADRTAEEATGPAGPSPRTPGSDAPWHDARPASGDRDGGGRGDGSGGGRGDGPGEEGSDGDSAEGET